MKMLRKKLRILSPIIMGKAENGFLQLDRYFSFKVVFHSYGRKWVPRHPSSPWSSPPKGHVGGPAPATQGRRSGTGTVAKGIGHASLGKGWASGTTNASLQWATCRPAVDRLVARPQKRTVSGNPWNKGQSQKGKSIFQSNLPRAMFVSGKVTETTYHSPFWKFTK